MRFDVSDLRIFRAVVEFSSMTRAAGAVHLTVASISERIKQMEDQVGVSLLSRSKSGVTPTEAGRVLLHHAHKVLKQVEFMNHDLESFSARQRTCIRLHATSYAISEILKDRLPAFLNANPDADLAIEEQHSEDIAFAVSNGSADIGIVGDFIDTGTLHVKSLLQDRLVAIAGQSHYERIGTHAFLSDLLNHDFLGLGQGSRLQEMLELRAREHGASIRYRVRVRNLDSICELAAADTGVAIVPGRTASRFTASRPGCYIVALSDDWANYNAAIIMKDSEQMPKSLSALLQAISHESKAPA